jgi:hypothetical protein
MRKAGAPRAYRSSVAIAGPPPHLLGGRLLAIEQQQGDQLLCEIICQANCGAIALEGLIKAIASP